MTLGSSERLKRIAAVVANQDTGFVQAKQFPPKHCSSSTATSAGPAGQQYFPLQACCSRGAIFVHHMFPASVPVKGMRQSSVQQK